MNALLKTRRAGFTLMELLVVVAILSLLSVIVLPNIAGSVNSRRYRDVAKNVSAFIARCQSRAIGSHEQKGVMFQPLSANTAASIDLYFADTPAVYAGETTTSVAMIKETTQVCFACVGTGKLMGVVCSACGGVHPPPAGIRVSPAVGLEFDDSTNRLMLNNFSLPGDAIQFGGVGVKYKFGPPRTNPPLLAFAAMWTEDNQNQRNTAWPRNPPPGAGFLPFKIWRQPTRGTGGTLQIPKGVCIDLAASCLGTVPFSNFMTTNIPENTISIMFDSTGKPSEIVHSGGVRTSVSAPIFLLVGEADLAGNAYDPDVSGAPGTPPDDRGGANWQYGDCIWLCIDNNSGVVKSGPVAGRKATVLESQRYVRLTIGYGSAEK